MRSRAVSNTEILSEVFRGTKGRLLDEFLNVWIPITSVYRRAVGYFSSSAFAVALDSFAGFFNRGGTMEVVCSPVLSLPDIHALYDGLYDGRSWEHIVLADVVRYPKSRRHRALLTWAIAHRQLEMRIAVLPVAPPHAVYHEKLGLFVLPDGDLVGFEGSANESSNAYVDNFERVVLHSGRGAGIHSVAARRLSQDFEALWNNQTPGVQVVPLNVAFSRRLLRPKEENQLNVPSDSSPPLAMLPTSPPEILRRPARLALRDYQMAAVREWFANNGMGIFAMATGTGKTIAALCTVEELYRKVGGPLVVIIVAPYINLVEQWKAVGHDFGLDPIGCHGSRSDWMDAVEAAVYLTNSGHRPVLSLITTNATFAETAFQNVLTRLQVRTVLIADEVHNLGARNLKSALPLRVKLRLGLSATPERWMDEDGTQAVKDYFGPVVFNLDLAAALKLDPPVLTQYSYFPILVPLETDEQDEYMRITRLLARYIDSPRGENLSDAALGLLLQRSRLVACARGKLPALASTIAPYRTSRYNLVYCGDGHMEVEATSIAATRGINETEVLRQVDAVARLLGTEMGMNVGIYTSDVSTDERVSILEDFEHGTKNALVAIRCLDEGVDIPNIRRAFILASSTNPRQFIQRRGRILRRADGKDVAEIFDFVVVPPFDAVVPGTPEYRVLRNLVTREMARVTEFAALALNGPQAHSKLLPILSSLRLMHL
jgi:superfamily II DNA or RNA helicase